MPSWRSGAEASSALRAALSGALRAARRSPGGCGRCSCRRVRSSFASPRDIGDYTDFYASIHHATNVGRLFRPDNPLLPNYKWVPIAYHGRASSIRVSGMTSRARGAGAARRCGAARAGADAALDYELEVGVFVGRGNALGNRVPLAQAEAHVFGLCLLNDWSARDVQAWEYQPLGPFLAKNFATTVSPWVVTLEALAPFRVPWSRPADEPPPLAYLDDAAVRAAGAIDIQLEVWLETARMRAAQRAAAAPVARELSRLLVDDRADARAPHGQRLQPRSPAT